MRVCEGVCEGCEECVSCDGCVNCEGGVRSV